MQGKKDMEEWTKRKRERKTYIWWREVVVKSKVQRDERSVLKVKVLYMGVTD